MKELSTIDTIVTYALTPLSWIYGAVTTVRNKLFDIGVLKQTTYDVPVISVGNITVGGTGKTPHIEFLLTNLCMYFKIGVISRGYKRKTRGFIIANSRSTPDSIGDEPYQVYQKFGSRVKVAVSESRRKGIEKLLQLHPEVNLILLDDAFQHRYVKPSTSILLVDYNRPIWDDRLLPLGRLRENRHSTDRADIVIITKCPDKLSPLDYRMVDKNLELLAFQKHYFSHFKYEPLKPVFPDDRPYDVTLEYLSSRDSILLVTGIAHPRTFVRYFKNYPFKVKVSRFSDHHDFSRGDMDRILKMFRDMKGEHKIIVTTEKDAVRLLNNPYFPEELKPLIYFLPVKVEMMNGRGDGSFLNDIRGRLGLTPVYEEPISDSYIRTQNSVETPSRNYGDGRNYRTGELFDENDYGRDGEPESEDEEAYDSANSRTSDTDISGERYESYADDEGYHKPGRFISRLRREKEESSAYYNHNYDDTDYNDGDDYKDDAEYNDGGEDYPSDDDTYPSRRYRDEDY